MIFDWRSQRYRGGSRWLSVGFAVVMVGVTIQVGSVSLPGFSYSATYQTTATYTATYQSTFTYTAEFD